MFNRGNTRVDVSSEPGTLVLEKTLHPSRQTPLALPAGTSGRYPERMIDQLPANYPCAKLKLDQFFLQWLSEHQDLVRPALARRLPLAVCNVSFYPVNALTAAGSQVSTLVEDIQAGRPIHAPTAPVGPSPLSPSTAHMIFASTVSASRHSHSHLRLSWGAGSCP